MDYTFPGQKDGEKVIKVKRKHLATLVEPAIKTLVFLVPATFILLKFNTPYLVVFSFIVFVLSLSYGLYKWVIWYGEIYIITSERVIGIFQKGIFSRKVAEIAFDRVNDVTFEVVGALSTAFGLGTVSIHSGNNLLELRGVSNPRSLQTEIIDLVEKKSEDKKQKAAKELVELIKGERIER